MAHFRRAPGERPMRLCPGAEWSRGKQWARMVSPPLTSAASDWAAKSEKGEGTEAGSFRWALPGISGMHDMGWLHGAVTGSTCSTGST